MAKIINESINSTNQIISDMIKVSNNSRITSEAANILADNLSPEDFKTIKEWLFVVRREKSQKNMKTVGYDPRFRF